LQLTLAYPFAIVQSASLLLSLVYSSATTEISQQAYDIFDVAYVIYSNHC